jgi:hypothetical protein
MATRRAKMPALKPPLILHAEVETLRVQVEALRGVLADLVGGTEALLREVNPMTPTAKNVDRLLRRSTEVMRTHACEQVRIQFERIERDARLVDFIERSVQRLYRFEGDWVLSLGHGLECRDEPLRVMLQRHLDKEERECW